MSKKIKFAIGLLIIFIPSIITKEFLFLSEQFYPSGINFIVGVDYIVRVFCAVYGLVYISKVFEE